MPIELDDRGRALENEYFRQKEKELLDKMRSKAETGKDAEMQCPRCDGALYETTYEAITIDVCNKCTGVWLDAGELAQVATKEEGTGGWFGKIFG